MASGSEYEKIVYIYNTSLVRECNRLPSVINRASMVQDLVNSYQLLLDDKFLAVQSSDATEDELKLFHSNSYIEFLNKVNNADCLEQFDDEQQAFGLGYDCPILDKNLQLVKTIAGGSISAAKILAGNKYKTAINWFGGWHHAQRNSAEGFCYVNDVVIAIQILRKRFDKILYVDLDIHHGDGVQNAFICSNKVMTLSFHKRAPGFYPGTGHITENGNSEGKYYTLNIPLREGLGHKSYLSIFNEVFNSVISSFKPNSIVVQCGADGLNGDPIGESNLTLRTIGECVTRILETDVPTLFLGGGGYNFANTARLWTYLTSVIGNIHLDEDIPDTCEYFTKYGPTYELHIDQSLRKDQNTEEYLSKMVEEINHYMQFIK